MSMILIAKLMFAIVAEIIEDEIIVKIAVGREKHNLIEKLGNLMSFLMKKDIVEINNFTVKIYKNRKTYFYKGKQ